MITKFKIYENFYSNEFLFYKELLNFEIRFNGYGNETRISIDIVDSEMYDNNIIKTINNEIFDKISELIKTIDSRIFIGQYQGELICRNIQNTLQLYCIIYIFTKIYKNIENYYTFNIDEISLEELLKNYDNMIEEIKEKKQKYYSLSRIGELNYIDYIINEIENNPTLINNNIIKEIINKNNYIKNKIDYLLKSKDFDLL